MSEEKFSPQQKFGKMTRQQYKALSPEEKAEYKKQRKAKRQHMTGVIKRIFKEMAKYNANLSKFVPRESISDILEKTGGKR